MNTPTLRTERLILRRFTEDDLDALHRILQDEEVNRFLPWFPMKSIEETRAFYEERYAAVYREAKGYTYAVCRREDNVPIGYIGVDADGSHELGYGLQKECWNQGIITEAGRAVIEQVRSDGIPYIIATHDRNNPRSGRVMQKLGMIYRYSYVEQWQPKDFPVVFRLYQLNFTTAEDFVDRKLWDKYQDHFIETL